MRAWDAFTLISKFSDVPRHYCYTLITRVSTKNTDDVFWLIPHLPASSGSACTPCDYPKLVLLMAQAPIDG